MHSEKTTSKKDVFIFTLMICTAILITVAGIYFHQSFLRILPLYVSLIIGMLQSRVNRFASLLGGINSILYGVVYIHYNLYSAAFSALLFSCPIQLLTFIRWNKNKWEHSTVLRKLNTKTRVIVMIAFIVTLVAMWFLMPLTGAEHVFLDSATSLLGIIIYFLTMFAYVEYTFLMIINGILTIILYITMLSDSPDTTTYLIYSVYSFICISLAFFQAKKLYNTQQQNTDHTQLPE